MTMKKSEEDDDDVGDSKMLMMLVDSLLKVKRRDHRINDKDVTLFEKKKKKKSHVEKQELRRKALCDALEAAEAEIDGNGDLFRETERNGDDDDREEDEELGKKIEEYFGEEALLDDNTKFLRDYELWKGKDEKGKKEAELEKLEEDDERGV